jgi:hypothetical protein
MSRRTLRVSVLPPQSLGVNPRGAMHAKLADVPPAIIGGSMGCCQKEAPGE